MNKVRSILILTILYSACAASSSVDVDRHVVPCGLREKVCQCREDADECEFTLIVEDLHTFVSYQLNDDGTRFGLGTPYYFNATGYLAPSFANARSGCHKIVDEKFDEAKCSVPMTVDGRTYRPFIAVNGQIPGPTLVVYENQFIVVNAINDMISESMTIHWHGMHQRNTP